MRPACRFFLKGRCRYGDACRFRHDAPARYGLPGRITGLVGWYARATVSAGAVLEVLDFPLDTDPALKAEEVETALIITTYRASRIIWLRYSDQHRANRAVKFFEQSEISDVKLRSVVRPPIRALGWAVQIYNVPVTILQAQVEQSLPRDLKPAAIWSGEPDYPYGGEHYSAAMAELIRGVTEHKTKSISEIQSSNPVQIKFSITFTGPIRLDTIARQLDSQRPAVLGRTKIYAHEVVTVRFGLRGDLEAQQKRAVAHCASRIQQEYKIGVGVDYGDGGSNHPTRISLQATNREALVAARRALDKVVAPAVDELLTPPPIPREQLARAQSIPCVICEDETDDIVCISECNHVACKECFLAYCIANIQAKNAMVCFGQFCNVLLPVDELCDNLNKNDILTIVKTTVDHYIKGRPYLYVKCAGIDCDAYFLKSEGEAMHICQHCFTACCPKCHVEYHFGQTCEEFAGEDVELAAWAVAAGAKQYPQCDLWVQKEPGGCDNMQCDFCRVRFCWVCLASAPSRMEVYQHLKDVHGGLYEEERRAMRLVLDILRPEPRL